MVLLKLCTEIIIYMNFPSIFRHQHQQSPTRTHKHSKYGGIWNGILYIHLSNRFIYIRHVCCDKACFWGNSVTFVQIVSVCRRPSKPISPKIYLDYFLGTRIRCSLLSLSLSLYRAEWCASQLALAKKVQVNSIRFNSIPNNMYAIQADKVIASRITLLS